MRPVVLLVGLVLLAGCSRPTPKLDALEADPMASVSIPGVQIEEEFEKAEGEALGKPHGAYFTRTFRVTKGAPQDVIRSVKELAEANGWTSENVEQNYYHATKRLVGKGQPVSLPADLTLAFRDAVSGTLDMTQE